MPATNISCGQQVLALVASGILAFSLAACGPPTQERDATAAEADKPGQWVELPISVGKAATGIAVTSAGDVYVGDIGEVYVRDRDGVEAAGTIPVEDLNRKTGRVLLLEKGTTEQKVVLDGVDTTYGIAVGADAIYTATIKPTIERFPKGANTPTDLPFRLEEDARPRSLTVDDAGRVYVIDTSFTESALSPRPDADAPTQLAVLHPTGSNAQLAVTPGGDVYGVSETTSGDTELRILATGESAARAVELMDVGAPLAMAVHAGDVYVLDDIGTPPDSYDSENPHPNENLRIVKFTKAAIESAAATDAAFVDPPTIVSTATLPFPSTTKGAYHAMAVGPNGAIFVTDGTKIFKMVPA